MQNVGVGKKNQRTKNELQLCIEPDSPSALSHTTPKQVVQRWPKDGKNKENKINTLITAVSLEVIAGESASWEVDT